MRMRIIIVILEFGFTRPWGQGPWGGFEQTLKNMAPKRVQKEGLKSHILGLFEFSNHRARSKPT